MWALRPPPLHHHHHRPDDHEGPIDLRKKVALDRETVYDHDREDDDHGLDLTPKDLTVGRRCLQQQQEGVLPARGLYPFMEERYGARCNLVVTQDEDFGDSSPRDQRNYHDQGNGRDLRNGHDPRRDQDHRSNHCLENGHAARHCHGLRNGYDPRHGHAHRNGHEPENGHIRNCHDSRNGHGHDLRNSHDQGSGRDSRDEHDVRNGRVLELAVSRLHSANTEKPEEEKEQRCKSTDAVFGKDGGQKPSRSSSCPDLTCIDLAPTNGASPPSHLHRSGPVPNPPSSPLGGAKKRKSFVPVYGDRSPSPTNLVQGSPSPKRPSPVYVHKTHLHHSPSPECGDRGYRRSPSPKRPSPTYGERLHYSPSPARRPVDEQQRRYHSPSPLRPLNLQGRGYHSPSPTIKSYRSPSPTTKGYRSPSPTRLQYQANGYRSPSPPRPPFQIKGYHSPSPTGKGFRSPSPAGRRPRSPHVEPPHYEEYFSHPEVLLRRQLNHQHPGASPFYLHVYDYYQHLVQRLRDQSSPALRASPPEEIDPTSDSQRKRPCRALTGKHVKQGTGASLSTLLSLRQMIQERQKAKERQPRPVLNGINGAKSVNVRKFPPKKARLNGKSPLSKVNC